MRSQSLVCGASWIVPLENRITATVARKTHAAIQAKLEKGYGRYRADVNISIFNE